LDARAVKQFLIDINTVTTFWVTAASEEKALESLKDATRALELRLQIGRKQPIEFGFDLARDRAAHDRGI